MQMLKLVGITAQPVLLSKADSEAVTTCRVSAYIQVVAHVSGSRPVEFLLLVPASYSHCMSAEKHLMLLIKHSC